jgi:TetR/AcrR family transcriptional repressor of mexJK operon
MPRAVGQIDRAKNEAILEAAADVLSERGLSAPMAMIARRAKVSKQTIYNHYGAKLDLIQALVQRRVDAMTAPLAAPGSTATAEDTLTAFAAMLLRLVSAPNGARILRLTIQSSGEMPELARDVFLAGPRAMNRRLSQFMAGEMKAGRLEDGDPVEAAEIFSGMTAGHRQTAALLGFPIDLAEPDVEPMARRIAQRFLKAYTP